MFIRMICPTTKETNFIYQSLNTDISNDYHQLSDLPAEEEQLLENSLDPLNPNPDYVEQQNAMPPHSIEFNLAVMNDFGQFEQEELYKIDHWEQYQQQFDEVYEMDKRDKPDQFDLPVQQDQQIIQSTLMFDDHEFQSIQYVSKKQKEKRKMISKYVQSRKKDQ